MAEIISLRGPVQKIDGKLVLRIPLQAGGDELMNSAKGISEVDGEYLKVFIPEWLAGLLRIEEGSIVSVNNENGKFNIQPIESKALQ